ncbi:hypothetical protein TSUD_182590 [Trifolium subterraneum]|uniref:Uncharacterized protein n=1 Tax=Trifolium subterraneum TaxID=3900 RepID=A0A2Z6MIB7_TRISU|nr:hypothetical protein TSUD_182590 [Trifolium subterraneum]
MILEAFCVPRFSKVDAERMKKPKSFIGVRERSEGRKREKKTLKMKEFCLLGVFIARVIMCAPVHRIRITEAVDSIRRRISSLPRSKKDRRINPTAEIVPPDSFLFFVALWAFHLGWTLFLLCTPP